MKKLLFLLFLIPSFCWADIKHPPLQINDNGSITYGYYYLLTITGTNTLTNPFDGTLTLACTGTPSAANKILLEDSTPLLLEDGTDMLTEK